jgi:hypothetical protein
MIKMGAKADIQIYNPMTAKARNKTIMPHPTKL